MKPRPVEFAIREKIVADLTRLLDLGAIEQVYIAEFGANLIVPVLKSHGAVKICKDYKVSVTNMQTCKATFYHTMKAYELRFSLEQLS